MREHAVALTTPPGEVFDTCGTGGDRSGTFNVIGRSRRGCGVRRESRKARKPIGVEPLRQRWMFSNSLVST